MVRVYQAFGTSCEMLGLQKSSAVSNYVVGQHLHCDRNEHYTLWHSSSLFVAET